MIDAFTGRYRWLSNFWPSDVPYDGQIYPSAEHAYQAAKTTDPLVRAIIQEAYGPGHAKALGKVTVLREGWHDMRLDVMAQIIASKFVRGTWLADRLVATGSQQLVEGNRWGDRFWGVSGASGENQLGRILMAQRASLTATFAYSGK